MNKAKLIQAVAAKAEIDKKTADKAVNAVLDAITETMTAGEKVQLIGFGSFEVRERAEKQARNPRTGEVVTAPACKVPAFKAGSALKTVINGK
ncbi:MAG: HU family DNA-binding protein [Acutalibacteraceae bacterium]